MNGSELIAEERQRQIEVEKWGRGHDDKQDQNELALAAVCYTLPPNRRPQNAFGIPLFWPWADQWWKPKNRIKDLVRAGALIAAEIDRLQRVQ